MRARSPASLVWLALAAGCTPQDDGDAPAPCDDPVACVDEARYTELLGELVGPRAPGDSRWQRAQDLCADTLAAAGYEVSLDAYDSGVNVIGRRPGATADADVVLVSAHYDGVPDCDAADDNASGVAGALVAAEVLAAWDGAHELQIACWDEEEDGLVGSDAYAARLDDEGRTVAQSSVFEMIGYRSDEPDSQQVPDGFEFVFPEQVAAMEANDWRGDFILLVADEHAAPMVDAFSAQAGLDGLPVTALSLTDAQSTSPLFGELQRSDHASFWARGWPATMINDTAEYRNDAYHCADAEDTLDRIDTAFATDVVRATVAATLALE